MGDKTKQKSGQNAEAAQPLQSAVSAAGSHEPLALNILVLLCGIGLMSLEMVGARVLWNNFGSSVFVWGSIISVFMAALALGYYLGGMLADRRPSLGLLSVIVAAAGLLTLFVSHSGLRLSAEVDRLDLGPRGGPLVASLVLYFVPSLLLGAVSPFAVRLRAKTVSGMGNVAGRIYALSTLGSLAGTLLTTFVLIPAMGTTKILYGMGVLLLIAALIAAAAARSGRSAALPLLTLTLGMGYFTSPAGWPGTLAVPVGVSLNRSVYGYEFLPDGREHESAYHNISVVGRFDASRYGISTGALEPLKGLAADPDAVVEMRFNNLTESSIAPNQPGRPPRTTYTKVLHMGMVVKPDTKKVLLVGLGGGSVPREFIDVYNDRDMAFDVVEVDSQVIDLARGHFFHVDSADDAKGVRTFEDDGRQFIRRSERGRFRKYDMIILDAYSGGGQIPAHLVTHEFLQQVKDRLEDDGVLVSNIINALEGPKSAFFRAEYLTISKLFSQIYVFPTHLGKPMDTRNIILVATRRDGAMMSAPEIVEATKKMIAKYPLLGERTASERLAAADLSVFAGRSYQVPGKQLEDTPVLTDEFAPVDTMFYWSTRYASSY